MGFELMTSSLPRMRSTPELHRLFKFLFPSGKRGSNSRPSAWKADALPTELLPLEKKSARNNHSQIFWWEVVDSNHRTLRERIYSPPQLPLCEPPSVFPFEPIEGFEPTTPRLQITCSGQLSYIGSSFGSFNRERDCKGRVFFRICKTFCIIFSLGPRESRRWTPCPGSTRPTGPPACPGR